jgi:hypothetical protein
MIGRTHFFLNILTRKSINHCQQISCYKFHFNLEVNYNSIMIFPTKQHKISISNISPEINKQDHYWAGVQIQLGE